MAHPCHQMWVVYLLVPLGHPPTVLLTRELEKQLEEYYLAADQVQRAEPQVSCAIHREVSAI